VRFSCDEIGLDVFGYNIENRALVSALDEPRIVLIVESR
jgi:2-octaprenyl-6-methoxyphenol hydroxylase